MPTFPRVLSNHLPNSGLPNNAEVNQSPLASMSQNIYLTWAVPVDPAEITAAIAAYESTKAALDTFRLCAHSAQSPARAPLRRVPPEILMIIEDYVLTSARTTELVRWSTRFDCLTDRCAPYDHMSDEDEEHLRGTHFQALIYLLHVVSCVADRV